MPATLHFWGWDRPVLPKAVSYIFERMEKSGGILANTLILVPTAEAGRRLREALATRAAERDGAVSLPYVWHPEIALTWGLERDALASRCQERMVWTNILRRLRPRQYPRLFPALPESVSSAWAMSAADTLMALKHLLGAGGHTMATAAAALQDHAEAERWAQLAAIERDYLAAITQLGLQDVQDAKRSAAAKPQLPPDIEDIWIFAAADPPGLLHHWLQQISETKEVHLFVQAPESLRTAFDEWGLPKPEVWSDGPGGCHRDLPDECIWLVPRPEDQARTAVTLLRESLEKDLPTVIGACDPALGAHLESALAAGGVRAYDPADKLAIQHRLIGVIRSWMNFTQTRAWKDLTAFLHLDDALHALTSAEEPPLSPSKLLRDLDQASARHLPPTLDEALRLLPEKDFPALRRVLITLRAHLDQWSQRSSDSSASPAPSGSEESPHSTCESTLRALLGWIYGATIFRTHLEEDGEMARLMGEAIGLASILDAGGRGLRDSLQLEDIQLLLISELEQLPLSDTRGEVDLVLHGWLEMLWEGAPGLVLTGFNEEHVPGVSVAHAFLPDSLRRRLGLASQATRRARDAYILAAMIEQRRANGCLHLILGRLDDDGNALKPSRLLFNCTDDALPRRIQRLFPKEGSVHEAPEPAWTQTWPLLPRREKPRLETISVSDINAYMACPFRYYLQRVLRMEGIDAAQRELDSPAFGSLVHRVLAEYGRSALSRRLESPEHIAGWLGQRLDQETKDRWGDHPFFTVTLQIESARQRLQALAKKLAELQTEGWTVLDTELPITPEWGLRLEGVPFTGRIDRLDARPEGAGHAYRIWDFKTGETDPKPFGKARAGDPQDPAESWKCFSWMGKMQKWSDLQLSLYEWAVRHRYPDAVSIEAGYIWMPAATGKAGYLPMPRAVAPEAAASAASVAEEAVRRIRSGIFWPPTAKPSYDDAAELWLGKDPAAAVDAAWMETLRSSPGGGER